MHAVNGAFMLHPLNSMVNHVTAVFAESSAVFVRTSPFSGKPSLLGVLQVAPTSAATVFSPQSFQNQSVGPPCD